MQIEDRESIKKILVVGSWAKEQITIENISKDSNVEIFSYMDIHNPGIMQLVKGYKVGSLYDIKNIVQYAQDQKIDMVIITTAGPLSKGLVDALENVNIKAFGPIQLAAKLEYDKTFARNLLQKYMPKAIPVFKICDSPVDAMGFSEELDWNVAVKPIGLTEGLGVKVFGDQLKNENDVKNYIKQIFDNKIGGSSDVIIEEKLYGEEFTIQCFVHGNNVLPTPAIQDFKKLLPGERGPNTASMGSISEGFILPFMKDIDYEKALEIIRKTLDAFHKETGKICSGFLYGQFMLTANGVKLVEYNFRPGDPEWLNTVSILKDNLLDVIWKLFKGEEQTLSFENCATVCKYIVPIEYPKKLNQLLNINIDQDAIKQIKNLGYYYSCDMVDEGKYNVGTERGIAFIAKGTNMEEANEKVEKAISMVDGKFYYREDIGTRDLIESKINHIKQIKKGEEKRR